jgi:Arc/MetJ-type ribon-helix-helix transcriptional regulator
MMDLLFSRCAWRLAPAPGIPQTLYGARHQPIHWAPPPGEDPPDPHRHDDACGTGGFPETAAAIANPARWAYTRYYEEGTPMATRTVRLDAEEERVLEELVRRTRLPVSDVLRRGIRALEKETTETAPRSPFEIYRQLDLGPGGYSNRPATESRRGAREAILRKHRR